MALLAEATLPDASTVQAWVRAELGEALEGSDELRLVVQVFGAGRRALGSAQRAVTADELRSGVCVEVVRLGDDDTVPRVVAWVERGTPDLEYEGLEATPSPNALLLDARVAA